MEIFNTRQADNAVATMRMLPWLATPSASWLLQAKNARLAAAAPVQPQVRTISLLGEGAYRLGEDPVSGMRPVIKTDSTIDLAWGTCADHKFSTRLGPSASPPV